MFLFLEKMFTIRLRKDSFKQKALRVSPFLFINVHYPEAFKLYAWTLEISKASGICLELRKIFLETIYFRTDSSFNTQISLF